MNKKDEIFNQSQTPNSRTKKLKYFEAISTAD